MKTTILNTATFVSIALGFSFSFAQTAMVQTDLIQVLGSGDSVPAFVSQVALKPGVYVIGNDDSEITGTKYLIVDQYINNAKKGLALLVDQDNIREKSSQATGKLYMIRPIQGGTTLMLSPIEIGLNGQLQINSELNVAGNSQVLTISQSPEAGKVNYPYIVKGHNGALRGEILGMRAKSDQNPIFRPWPAHSIFNSETDSGKLVVQNKIVSISDPRLMDREFELVPINGVLGKMAALVSTKLNTMEEGYRSQTAIKELAFFMSLDGCELFMIAKPNLTTAGEYTFSFYGPRHRSIVDFFRKGRLSP